MHPNLVNCHTCIWSGQDCSWERVRRPSRQRDPVPSFLLSKRRRISAERCETKFPLQTRVIGRFTGTCKTYKQATLLKVPCWEREHERLCSKQLLCVVVPGWPGAFGFSWRYSSHCRIFSIVWGRLYYRAGNSFQWRNVYVHIKQLVTNLLLDKTLV